MARAETGPQTTLIIFGLCCPEITMALHWLGKAGKLLKPSDVKMAKTGLENSLCVCGGGYLGVFWEMHLSRCWAMLNVANGLV